MTGTKSERPELERLQDKFRPGDIVVVKSFSRLGRNTKDLIELINCFEEHDIKLISSEENFNTSTPQGRFMMTIFQAFNQFKKI